MAFGVNILDRFIGYLNPRIGAERLKYRAVQNIMAEKVRKFDAGSTGRKTKGWRTSSSGANLDLHQSIKLMRERSIDLYQNNTDAFKAINTIVANVVGTGIRPSFSVSKNLTQKQQKNLKESLNKAWKSFSKKKCDFNEKLTFYGIQLQIARTVFIQGSAIVRVRRNNKGFPFSFQVFEPNILDHSKDTTIVTGGGYIVHGVEHDSDGKIVAYWLFDHNPNEAIPINNLFSKRVPKKDEQGIYNVIHIFDQIRPGQSDGLPIGVSAFLKMRDLDMYEDAELTKQMVSACHAGFIHDSSADLSTAGLTKDKNGDFIDKLEPGSISVLEPGKTITFSNPPTNTGYGEHVKSIKRSEAAGYGVTYEDMTGDLSNANFSSLKAGKNAHKKLVQIWQDNLMITDFNDPVCEIFLLGCDLKGIIKLADREDPTSEIEVSWTPPAIDMVDPAKEIPALIKLIRAGLASWQDVQRQLGNDPLETLEELAADNKLFDEHGLKLDSDPRADPNRITPDINAKPPN